MRGFLVAALLALVGVAPAQFLPYGTGRSRLVGVGEPREGWGVNVHVVRHPELWSGVFLVGLRGYQGIDFCGEILRVFPVHFVTPGQNGWEWRFQIPRNLGVGGGGGLDVHIQHLHIHPHCRPNHEGFILSNGLRMRIMP